MQPPSQKKGASEPDSSRARSGKMMGRGFPSPVAKGLKRNREVFWVLVAPMRLPVCGLFAPCDCQSSCGSTEHAKLGGKGTRLCVPS